MANQIRSTWSILKRPTMPGSTRLVAVLRRPDSGLWPTAHRQRRAAKGGVQNHGAVDHRDGETGILPPAAGQCGCP
ncbi:MAG: hypothetical protein MZV64_20845 [Ignavibacteriales bacterium]|nr:hypothetical protein [Ignavibacteriales bacterium]